MRRFKFNRKVVEICVKFASIFLPRVLLFYSQAFLALLFKASAVINRHVSAEDKSNSKSIFVLFYQ